MNIEKEFKKKMTEYLENDVWETIARRDVERLKLTEPESLSDVEAKIIRFGRWIRRKLNVYKIEDLQIGGHCGLCGKWVNNEILPRDWAITICDKCQNI